MGLRHNALLVAALGGSSLLPACNPYQNFDKNSEFYAGPIDATTFPKAYQGALPGPADQGGGTISPNTAFVNGADTFYYLFPLGAGQGADPDGVLDDAPLTIERLSIPDAYVFDPVAQPANALPSPGKCAFSKDYRFDQRTEDYRHDEQGVIFTALPTAAYFPIVAEVPVTSNGEACQSILSKAAVKSQRTDITVGKEDGKYLAFAEIDPTADVQPNGANGLGPIHEGFYNKYLVTFIDGGYIPTVDVPAMGMDDAHTDFVTQRVFFPSSVAGVDDMMMPAAVANDIGGGFDILEAARGDAAYSPICEVWTYDPDLDADMLPIARTSVGDLSATEMASAAATGDLVFCLQVF